MSSSSRAADTLKEGHTFGGLTYTQLVAIGRQKQCGCGVAGAFIPVMEGVADAHDPFSVQSSESEEIALTVGEEALGPEQGRLQPPLVADTGHTSVALEGNRVNAQHLILVQPFRLHFFCHRDSPSWMSRCASKCAARSPSNSSLTWAP